jgi:pilus assembly protein FimV
VVKQYTESQYDDDLTLGSDDYDDSYYSDADDLFELSTDNESPISRLKSLVLSIDWEITDDVLRQFNEELVDLRSIWAGETINLVYVQALEKLSKYIYQNKADSHPSAIKLLLTFYYNLEKIVSSPDLPEEQKKEILLEDVKRFENLKRQIKVQPVSAAPVAPPVPTVSAKIAKPVTGESELFNLKAIVLGIDWEITEQDLNELRKEVLRLEEKYAESRPKLILLQGIGTLAAYIKVKKSNSHPDAFKILQHFYEQLECIVERP